jgi:hypothetical protein
MSTRNVTRVVLTGYGLIILYTLAPVLSVLISSGIATALGAKLDESQTHPAYLLGINIGGLLSIMFIAGWLALITIPTGLLALVVFTIVWPISLAAKKVLHNSDDKGPGPK